MLPSSIGRRDAIDGFAAAVMVGITFSWGLNQVAIRVADTGFSPVFLTAARSAIGGLLVFAWCRYRGIPLFERDATLPAGIVVGLLFGAEFVLIFIGLDFTTAARGTLMLNTMPFFVLVGAHFFLGEKITLPKAGGLLLAFSGVYLVFSDNVSLPDPQAIKGDLMCLVAGAVWGATIIIIKRSPLAGVSAEKTLLYQLAVSAVMAVCLVPFGGPILRDVSLIAISSLLFQSIYIVGFTYVMWFWLMRRYPAAGLSSFTFLTPAFGVLLGGLLLGEPLSVKIFAALALIAVGLVVVNRPPTRRQSPQPGKREMMDA